MGKSFKIATIGGIPLKIHWTFPLIFVAIFLFGGINQPIFNFLVNSAMVLVVFLCVTLHEFGHVYAASRYGVRTLDVIISPIGGVARLTSLPRKPIQEFIVAIAGPLVNVVIAGILSLILKINTGDIGIEWQGFEDFFRYYEGDGYLYLSIRIILGINLLLVGFNLIPAFPMDGGRMFRALLSLKLSRLLATRLASLLGQLGGVFFIIYGINSTNYTLPIIGVFIFMFARNEYQSVKVNEILKSFSASDVMRTVFTALQNDTTVEIAKEYLLKDDSGDFIITDDEDDYQGVITRRSLNHAIKSNALDQLITAFAAKKIEVIHPTENVKKLFYQMQEQQLSAFIVQDEDGQLLGIIDIKRFQEFLQEQQKKHRMKLF